MKTQVSRRSFLGRTAYAATGMIFASAGLNAMSLSENQWPGYNPYATEKTDLRRTGFAGKHVQVRGKIYGESGRINNEDVWIEVWHLSPGSKKYRHMAKLRPDALGAYEFITDYPAIEGSNLAKIYFRISDRGGAYTTQLLFNKHGAVISDKHWEENFPLEENLFPTMETFLNKTELTFNVYLNHSKNNLI